MTQQTCPDCYGYGHRFRVTASELDRDGVPWATYEPCPTCHGRGAVTDPQQADEFADLTEDEQAERFASYGEPGDRD